MDGDWHGVVPWLTADGVRQGWFWVIIWRWMLNYTTRRAKQISDGEMITIEEFCNRPKPNKACRKGREWALANCANMQDVWDTAPPKWLTWVATRPGVLTDRELRLFTCWSMRQVWHLLTDERSRAAVEVAERFANGDATADDMAAARAEARMAAATMVAAAMAARAEDTEEAEEAAAAAAAASASAEEEAEAAAEAAAWATVWAAGAAAARAAARAAAARAEAARAEAGAAQAAYLRRECKPSFAGG